MRLAPTVGPWKVLPTQVTNATANNEYSTVI